MMVNGRKRGMGMKTRIFLAAALLACGPAAAADLPAPGFHHLMLNTVDPDAAIAYYTKAFPDTKRTTWEGYPALSSPNNVLLLFNKVAMPPVADSQITAYWHFGWNAVDERAKVGTLLSQEFKFAPLWTGIGEGAVTISSDSYPGLGGVYGNGETREQMADAQAKGVKPLGGAGFAYLSGPDNALIEVAGNNNQERMNHIHMWEDEPFCAQLWYRTHLNANVAQRLAAPGAPPAPVYTEANCHVDRGVATWPSLTKEGMYRYPTTGVLFGDVAMNWYMDQTDKPLVGTRGHLMDNVGLSVSDLDAWVAKLKAEKVTFLRQPFKIGGTRAVMIEGPSHEAIELVEVK